MLVVCLGQATRVAEYLLDARKTYRARIRLGIETDTYDADGEIVRTSDPSSVTREAVEQALDSFRGVIQQRHRCSAPSSATAFRSIVTRAPAAKSRRRRDGSRSTGSSSLEFANRSVTLDVECGRGFYVRSLAHDLGERLDCGAHLEQLTRTAVGRFRLEAAVDVETLRRSFDDGTLAPSRPAARRSPARLARCHRRRENAANARRGRPLNLTPVPEARAFDVGMSCRAYSLDGRLIALLDYAGNAIWQPAKVFEGADSPV